jgi:uncharacterized OB-fold protein
MSVRMVPNVHDRDTREFFAAAAEGRLVFKSCRSCAAAIHPPGPFCTECGSMETEWRQAGGTGRLHTWTTVTHQIHAAYAAPYTVVVVELDDAADVRLVGYIEGEPELAFGQPMQVWFEDLGDGVALPQWRAAIPASAAGG